MIRKILSIILVICAVSMLLTGCSSVAVSQSQIWPAELTDEQKSLVNFLSTHHSEILLFDYTTAQIFQNVEFWLEIYEYGVLAEQVQGIYMINNELEPVITEGRLAVIINRDFGNFSWTFIKGNQYGGFANNRFESMAPNLEFARSFGPIVEPVTIQDGEEIILYISKFSENEFRVFNDHQIFLEKPELMAEYSYVYIIKARFSS